MCNIVQESKYIYGAYLEFGVLQSVMCKIAFVFHPWSWSQKYVEDLVKTKVNRVERVSHLDLHLCLRVLLHRNACVLLMGDAVYDHRKKEKAWTL